MDYVIEISFFGDKYCNALKLRLKIRFIKMIITLSVSVELTYLHILGGRLHSIRKQCTLQVLFGHTIRCVQIEILSKRHSLSMTSCIVSCILDSWVAYGLVILFHSFYAYYYFQFWTPKLIIYEFCVQEGPHRP